MIKIAFVGDITPGGVMVSEGGIGEDVKAFLTNYDLRVATLESCFGQGYDFCSIKMNDAKLGNIIYSPDECVNVLKELDINVVSLANNHVCDCGLEGLYHTIDLLDSCGIAHFGAGKNIIDAAKPVIVNVKGKSVCILGYYPPHWPAPYPPTDDSGGINQYYVEKIIDEIKFYKSTNNYVFVIPHWGKEQTMWPSGRMGRERSKYSNIIDAYKFISAGATGVIGSHTHIVQPIIMYNGGIIAMSLGNFIFPDRYLVPPRAIYYPTKEELRDVFISQTDEYPFVNQLTYKHSPDNGRMGIICGVMLDKEQCSYTKQYTYLDSFHWLHLANIKKSKKICLWYIGCLLKDDSLVIYRIHMEVKSVYRYISLFLYKIKIKLTKWLKPFILILPKGHLK